MKPLLAAEEEPLAEWGVEMIAEPLMLRVELINVSREVPRSGAPIRRLLLAFSPEGNLVRLDDFQEHEVAKAHEVVLLTSDRLLVIDVQRQPEW